MKEKILTITVAILGAQAIIRLSGLLGSLHFTPARVLFICLVFAVFGIWILCTGNKRLVHFWRRQPSVCFQAAILAAVLNIILIILGNRLISSEGALYQAGAFIRQAVPFLIYLSGFFFCLAAFAVSDSNPVKKLLFSWTPLTVSLLIFLVSLLIFAAFFPLRANYYPSHDYSIFAYIGQQILRGKMPYTELWDHKPPLIFYLNALGLRLAGGSLAGIWVLEFTAFFVGNLIFYLILKRCFPKWISLFVLLTGMLHYVRVLDFGNYTEEVSLFFVFCTLGLFFRRNTERHVLLCGIAAGLCCGAAFTSKQNTIGCWCALLLMDIIRAALNKSDKALIRRCVKFWLGALGGFLAVNAAWVIYFACSGALAAYWDVAFRFNLIYSEKSGESRLACAWTTLTFLPTVSPYLFLSAVSWFSCAFEAVRNGAEKLMNDHPLAFWALLDLPIELFFAGLSGMNYQHYFILCIPPLTVLLCAAVNALSEQVIRFPILFRVTAVCVLILASFPLLHLYADNYSPRMPSAYTKSRDYLLRQTDPDRPILVWGSRSALYVMSERYAPTAYFNERPLYLFQGDVRASQWEELLSDILRDPPQVIIWTHDSALPFIAKNSSGCTMPAGADYTVPVYSFFCENYRYETTINEGFSDAWEVYAYTK